MWIISGRSKWLQTLATISVLGVEMSNRQEAAVQAPHFVSQSLRLYLDQPWIQMASLVTKLLKLTT